MAHTALVAAFSAIMATAAAAQPDAPPPSMAPEGTPTTRYCLRVDPITGSRMETVQCRTREDWASLEVDVDKEWAENGVRVLA